MFNKTLLLRKNIVFIVTIVRNTINLMQIMKTNICKLNQFKKINPIKWFLIIKLIIKTNLNAVAIFIFAFNDYLYYFFFQFYYLYSFIFIIKYQYPLKF